MGFEELVEASLVHDATQSVTPTVEYVLVVGEEFTEAALLVKFNTTRLS
jgi:hypothetical protein